MFIWLWPAQYFHFNSTKLLWCSIIAFTLQMWKPRLTILSDFFIVTVLVLGSQAFKKKSIMVFLEFLNSSVMSVYYYCPFLDAEGWSTEKESNLLKITQLVSCQPKAVRVQSFLFFLIHCFFPYATSHVAMNLNIIKEIIWWLIWIVNSLYI